MKRGVHETTASGKARPVLVRVYPSPKRKRGVVEPVACAPGDAKPVACAPGSDYDSDRRALRERGPVACAPGSDRCPRLPHRFIIIVWTVLLMTDTASAYAQTLEAATISTGGGILPDGSIIVIGQPVVGTMSNAEYTIEVGIVPLLEASACPTSSSPIAETLPATPLQSPLAGGTDADATGLPVNTKNRFASIKTADAGRDQAIRVRFVDLPSPFTVWNGMDFWAGVPREVCENSGKGLETDPADCPSALPTDTFWAAPLLCAKEAAHFMDWRGLCDAGTCVGGLIDGAGCLVDDDCVEVVHFYHEGLVPGGIYEIQVMDITCSLQDEGAYSAALTMFQSAWGDVCGPGSGGACSGAADGVVDVTNDVLGILDKFANVNNLQKARADLEPGDDAIYGGTNNGPDFKVNVANDVLYCLDAFTGAPYPFEPGDPCDAG